jgi:hypothetical protein
MHIDLPTRAGQQTDAMSKQMLLQVSLCSVLLEVEMEIEKTLWKQE